MIFYSIDFSISSDRLGAPFHENIFADIKEATSRISSMSNEMDYIAVMACNYEAIFNAIDNIAANGQLDFVDINACFSNFLNSCYTWKCYHNHLCREIFEKLQNKYRQKHIIYRLGEELRHYTTHKAIAITRYVYDVLSETGSYQIDPQAILELDTPNHKLNAQLKKWLKDKVEMNQRIDALSVTKEYYKLCQEVQQELWSSYIQLIHKDLSAIFSTLPLTTTNIYNVSIISDDQSVSFPMGQIVAQFLQKAAHQCPSFILDSYVDKF